MGSNRRCRQWGRQQNYLLSFTATPASTVAAVAAAEGGARALTLEINERVPSRAMDVRHRKILEALRELRGEGESPATAVDVALKLGLRRPEDMGTLFSETHVLGWVRPVNKNFAGQAIDFELTPEGERELHAAYERAEPPVTLEDVEPQIREILDRCQVDQPLYAGNRRTMLGIDALTDDDADRLLRQMGARGMV
jgi:hypothetical protein